MSKITGIFERLCAESRRLGDTRSYVLFRDARMVVRASEAEISVTVGRKRVALGEREIVTFHRDCNVPAHARRLPSSGQHEIHKDGDVWHVVCWKWPVDQ